MTQSIQYIQEQLQGIYPPDEIKSFTKILFENICNIPPYQQVFHKDIEISESKKQKLQEAITRLKNHEPIQYIIGSTVFFNRDFMVEPGVLIPRPETEELMEMIVRENQNKPVRILDIGTGSGCIPVTLSLELPQSTVYSADISEDALCVAQKNIAHNKTTVSLIHCDILDDTAIPRLPQQLDIIVSNPPYVMESEKTGMENNVLVHEPHLALFVPDEDPLLFYNRIADLGRTLLKEGGRIYFELNALLAQESAEMMISKGYKQVSLHKDLFGKLRFLTAVR